MSKNGKDKIEGKGVLVRGVVICIAVAIIPLGKIGGEDLKMEGKSVKLVTVPLPWYKCKRWRSGGRKAPRGGAI